VYYITTLHAFRSFFTTHSDKIAGDKIAGATKIAGDKIAGAT